MVEERSEGCCFVADQQKRWDLLCCEGLEVSDQNHSQFQHIPIPVTSSHQATRWEPCWRIFWLFFSYLNYIKNGEKTQTFRVLLIFDGFFIYSNCIVLLLYKPTTVRRHPGLDPGSPGTKSTLIQKDESLSPKRFLPPQEWRPFGTFGATPP